MPKSRNSYNKGLNQDASRSKSDAASYYDALNIRVVTHDGLSTGSIENENGNQLTFELPDLLAENHTFPDGTTSTIPAQLNLEIIGWCTLNEYIILFSTSATTPGVGQIWRIKYDEATNAIENTAGPNFTLNPTDHLRYNGSLNFSAANRIEAIGRYENGSTGRVYWTDFNNNLRTFNVLDDTLRTGTLPNIRTIKPSTLNIKPNVTFSTPKPIAVGLGNLPAAGKVQYAYRLINSEGAQTMFSPASALVSLTEANPNTIDYHLYEGSASLIADSRSVTFSVQGIDQDYEIIEHIAVLYTEKDAPTVFKFGEENVPLGGNLEITLSGNETRIEISLVEYSAFSVGFENCKTLTAKDNRLVVGNIKTSPAEINFDARAYRFKAGATPRALLSGNSASTSIPAIEIDGNTLLISSPAAIAGNSWTTIPGDHDAINLFNDENPDTNNDWFTNDQYKYQANGVTLGGQGPNVSYTFVQQALVGDTNNGIEVLNRRSAPFISVPRASRSINLGDLDSTGASQIVNVSSQFDNFSSPIIESHLTGYTRGEVYRFGIEFITKQGTPTFVQWIGDIKFPEPEDGFPVGFNSNGTIVTGQVNLNTLGIRFSVNISSIRDQISGYRIVRAERTDANRTRLGTGTFFITDMREESSSNDVLYRVIKDDRISPYIRQIGMNEIDINGDDQKTGGGPRLFHLNDQPGINLNSSGFSSGQHPHQEFPNTKGVVSFMSPLNYLREYNGFNPAGGDYLKTLGYYTTKAVCYVRDDLGGAADMDSQGWLYVARNFQAIIPGNHTFNINNTETFVVKTYSFLEDGEFIPESSAKLATPHIGNAFLNGTYTEDDEDVPLGIGNDTMYMELADDPLISGNHVRARNMGWNATIRTGVDYNLTATNAGDNAIDETFYIKEVAYIRPLQKQYGGNTYEDRSKQQYISTNHYQPIDEQGAVSSSLQFDVYGGDTYVNYFGKEFIQQYLSEPAQNPKGLLDPPADDEKLSIAYFMPTESYINTDLVYGRHFNKSRDGNDFGAYVGDVFTHNRLYEQQSNAENKFFAKDFAINFVEEFPHRLWASDKKLDGEQLDSWRSFLDANYIDVEGSYGPINKVINFQDKVFYYQDRAVGIGAINERSAVTDTSGVELVLGTGTVLDQFRYVSTETGCFHQHAVVSSGKTLYHYDVLKRKMYAIGSNGTGPISDIKGLSAFFANNVEGNIIDTDLTLGGYTSPPVGIHGAYDHRHNRVLFTFLSPRDTAGVPDISTSFTIGYNEFLQAYESFYSFTPEMYLDTGRRLISKGLSANFTDPALGQGFLHDAGIKGIYYNSNPLVLPTPEVSSITLLISPDADLPKIFNNIEYNSEVSLANVQQPLETLTELEIFNDYQTTGAIPLIVGTNIKRRIRHWRHVIGRDTLSANQRARMRDYSIFLKLTYANNNDKRLVLHDIIVSYTPARD